MGVKGLWEVLKAAETTVSLETLGVSGFTANHDGDRGFRVGIDASIWFHQVSAIQGQNSAYPKIALQILFSRCANLLAMPMILPLFVFDGPDRPKVKRGKAVSHRDSPLVTPMKELVHAFGFEWCSAPGEAEAELAYLNTVGAIDAVMTDDVDVFLFGATTVIRNPGSNLNTNDQNAELQLPRYDTTSLEQKPLGLTRAGMILIALLSGGDYNKGVKDAGITISYGLAKCGFGETLLSALELQDNDAREDALSDWRESVQYELRTNSQRNLPRKQPKLADEFPHTFPSKIIAGYYTNPVVSGPSGNAHSIQWRRDPDISDLASFAEEHFSWGHVQGVLERFRSKVWPGTTLRIIRHAALWIDELSARERTPLFKTRLEPMAASPLRRMDIHQLFTGAGIVSGDADTPILVELSPAVLQRFEKLAAGGMLGTRSGPAVDSEVTQKKRKHASSHTMSIPAAIIKFTLPEVLLDSTHNPHNSSGSPPRLSRKKTRVSPLLRRIASLPEDDNNNDAGRDGATAATTQVSDNAFIVCDDGNVLQLVDGVIDLTQNP